MANTQAIFYMYRDMSAVMAVLTFLSSVVKIDIVYYYVA